MRFIVDPAVVEQDLEKGGYDAAERRVIDSETARLYAAMTAQVQKSGRRQFYLTSGGPGAGKTTLIRREQAPGGFLLQAVHVDPDEILRRFSPYQDMIRGNGDTDAARAAAYERWRHASTCIANRIMNRLAQDGHDIVLGVTATSPMVRHLYDNAHAAGYDVTLLICHAPEAVRLQSTQRRLQQERRFTPAADVLEKGNVLFPAILGLHFSKADHIRVYWRGAVEDDLVLAAATDKGKVAVRQPEQLQDFVDEIRRHKPDFAWAAAVRAFESRFGRKPAGPQPKQL